MTEKSKLDLMLDKQRAEFTVPISEKTKQEKGTSYSVFLITISYSLGGMNYFTGQSDPRGYRVVISPASITETAGGGRILSATILGKQWESGLRFFIEPTKRYNRKRLEELALQVYKIGEDIAEDYEKENYQDILGKVQDFANSHVQV